MRHDQLILIDDLAGVSEQIQIQRARAPALSVMRPPLLALEILQLLQQTVGFGLRQ